MQLAKRQAGLISKKYLNINTLELVFKPVSEFSFIPGQFISVEVAENTFRTYSLANRLNQQDVIVLLITLYENGIGSNYFRTIQVGDGILYIGPRGKFRLHESSNERSVFLATSTGIAPFISMAEKELLTGKSVKLLWGLRTKEFFYYNEFIEYLSTTYTNFYHKICFSQDVGDDENFLHGRITGHLPIYSDTTYYLCGNPIFIEEARVLLTASNIYDYDIHAEKYTQAKVL